MYITALLKFLIRTVAYFSGSNISEFHWLSSKHVENATIPKNLLEASYSSHTDYLNAEPKVVFGENLRH